MTAPLLPLDVLAGYTVTREGPHFYTLTPTERTATMNETDPRDVEWWNSSSPDFEREYADEEIDEADLYQSRAEWREVPR